jgi:hypothetical protein
VQRLLDASDNLPQFMNDLLTTQAVLVAGTEAAAFLSQKQEGKLQMKAIAHIRPDDSDEQTRAAALRAFQGIVQPCIEQGKDGAIEIGSPDGGDSQYCLVTVLRNEGEVVGACAVITRARDLERAKQRLTSMQLVAGYFELYSLKRYVEHSKAAAERHQQVLQFAGAVGTAEGFESAAMNLCNEMATRTGATRVTIGWLKGRRIRVKALSHTEKFDKKQELIVQLEKVMEECFDQEEAVRYDPNGDCTQNVTRAAEELSRVQGGNIVLSVPLRRREELVGVMTVEWPAGTEVDEEDEAGVGIAAELLAPQLYDRYCNDRLIVTKMCHSIGWLAKKAVGPRHTGIKLLIVAAIALGLFVALFSPVYHVRSSFVLVPKDMQSVCAPFDGMIEKVNFRPGDHVKAGQVIATMDVEQYRLDLKRFEAEVASKELDAQRLDAEGKSAEANIALEQAKASAAQADRCRWYLSRAEMKAPYDGYLTKGDLYDRRWQPAKVGEELFQIARVDENGTIICEAELHIQDRDIQELMAAIAKDRQFDGDIATTTFPDKDFKIKIHRVVPQGEPKDGENVFKVYATIDSPEKWLRPGIGGEARIDTDPRSLWWIWTHRLGDWLKLKLWM